MKTPREILLKRHQEVEAGLDAVREQVVGEHFASRVEKTAQPRASSLSVLVMMKLWRELVLPCRRIWTGMAAVWVAIIIFGLATGERETKVADAVPATAPDVALALKEQRQMLAQLLDRSFPTPMDRPRTPRPRSEQRQTIMFV